MRTSESDRTSTNDKALSTDFRRLCGSLAGGRVTGDVFRPKLFRVPGRPRQVRDHSRQGISPCGIDEELVRVFVLVDAAVVEQTDETAW